MCVVVTGTEDTVEFKFDESLGSQSTFICWSLLGDM